MNQFHTEEETPDSHSQTLLDDERRLYRVMLWGYVTLLPAAAMFIVTAALSDSVAIGVYAASYFASIAAQTFSIYAIRQTIKGNIFRFPYGAGKLENFSAFLDGVLLVPIGLYMANDALGRFVAPLPVGYALGIVPVVVSGVRLMVLYVACRRLIRNTAAPSPILTSYTIGYRVGLLSNLGVLVAFTAGWALVHFGLTGIGNRVDPAIGLSLALYMMWAGAGLVWRNFRALMDMPLTESEQLLVMKVLVTHYDDYEAIGTIFTRTSGKARFVELELLFPAGRTLGEVKTLAMAMERDLAKEIPGLNFRIIPVAAA
jgi:cation diffusion facilitator family transporter